MPIERRRAYYSGRVQGVGFRFISQRLAREFPISGSVRNLSDGRVELIAQGDAEVVSSYLEAVARELAGNIHEIHVESDPVTDPHERDFSIRY
jgi:acylphosphatase